MISRSMDRKTELLVGGHYASSIGSSDAFFLAELRKMSKTNASALHAAIMAFLTEQASAVLAKSIKKVTAGDCASWLFSKRCTGKYSGCPYCIPGADHSREILTDEPPYRQMWVRPYRWSLENMQRFMTFVEEHKLVADFRGDPTHYPGKTFMIVLQTKRPWISTTRRAKEAQEASQWPQYVPPAVDYPSIAR